MKKKYGFIIMGDYDVDKDRARFESKDLITEIVTVRNMEEAKLRLASMRREGFGAIETCGAFSEEDLEVLKEVLGGEVGIARVVATRDQGQLLKDFFQD